MMNRLISPLISAFCLSMILTVLMPIASQAQEKPVDHQALLVQNPELALKIRTDLIAAENQEIFANFHMWDSRGEGLASLAQLCLKAKSGVRVRLVSDGLSRNGLNLVSNASLIAVINDLCVSPDGQKFEIRFWNAMDSKLMSFFKTSNLHRSHEKVLLLTGQQIAYEGDRNWQNVNFRKSSTHPAYSYLSTDIVIHGGIAAEVQSHLEKVWAASTPLKLKVQSETPDKPPKKYGFGKYSVESYNAAREEFTKVIEVVRSRETTTQAWRNDFHPVSDVKFLHYEPAEKLKSRDESVNDDLLELLRSAKKTVYITTPYLRLPDAYFDALKELRERGVEIKLVTSNPRSKIVSRTYGFQNRDIKRLKKIGVSIFQTEGEDPLHMKSIVIDNSRIFVGTHNLDMRSAYMDMESGFIVTDAKTAGALQAFLLPYEKPYKMRRPLSHLLLEPLVQVLLKISIMKKQL